MGTPVTNFGKVTASTGYASGATSIVLVGGHGSRLPSTFTYPLSWWNSTDYADPADDPDREIVTVTNRVTDTLTVTRGAESTSASNKNIAGKTYTMSLGLTKAMWESIFNLSLSQDFRGLSVQTHPDSDKALAQVRLIHADAIVMDDGEEIADWNDLDANLAAAAGIGGLDTGTEQASTWYQIIAGYNGTTKGIYLHRAKDYFLDEDITAGEDASQGLRSAVDNSTVRIAQGFQVGTAGLMEMIDVKLIKTGTPPGNIWFTVEATSGGVPSNTPLATSDKYDVSRITTTATVVRFPFRVPASLSAATQYHIVMHGDYTVSATNFVNWRMDGSAATYANGSKALFDSDTSTWTNDTDDDMYLKVYITRNDTALTKPAGYTQSAVIGWAYNNGSSNLIPFLQQDRVWRMANLSDALVVNETAAGPVLVDLRAFVPPIEMLNMMIGASGTGAAVGQIALGDIKCTDVTIAVAAGAQLYLLYGGTAEAPGAVGMLVITASAFMYDGTVGMDLFAQGFQW